MSFCGKKSVRNLVVDKPYGAEKASKLLEAVWLKLRQLSTAVNRLISNCSYWLSSFIKEVAGGWRQYQSCIVCMQIPFYAHHAGYKVISLVLALWRKKSVSARTSQDVQYYHWYQPNIWSCFQTANGVMDKGNFESNGRRGYWPNNWEHRSWSDTTSLSQRLRACELKFNNTSER